MVVLVFVMIDGTVQHTTGNAGAVTMRYAVAGIAMTSSHFISVVRAVTRSGLDGIGAIGIIPIPSIRRLRASLNTRKGIEPCHIRTSAWGVGY